MECLSLFYLPTYVLTLPSTIKKQYKNEWKGKYLNTESVFSFLFSAAIRIGSKRRTNHSYNIIACGHEKWSPPSFGSHFYPILTKGRGNRLVRPPYSDVQEGGKSH